MARAHLRHTIKDRAGNVIQSAKANVYLKGTTTPVSDMFAAESGGAAITTLTSNNQGEVEAWFVAAKYVDLNVTDNADTAFYPSEASRLLTFTAFTETVEVPPPPDEVVTLAGTQELDSKTLDVPVIKGYTRAGLPTAGTAGRIARVTDGATPDNLVEDNGTNWRSLYSRATNVVVVTDPQFGAKGDGVTDDTAAIQAAINSVGAVEGRNTTIFFPTGTYKLTSTINLADKQDMVFKGAPAYSLGPQLAYAIGSKITGGDFSLFQVPSATRYTFHIRFENLNLVSQKRCLDFEGVVYFSASDCSFWVDTSPSGSTFNTPVLMTNSFLWTFERCTFRSASVAKYAMTMLGTTPAFDVDQSYLVKFRDCVFENAGVRYQQNVVTGIPGLLFFDNCLTQNLNGGSLLSIGGSVPSTLGGVSIIDTSLSDSIGNCPYVDVDSGFTLNSVLLMGTTGNFNGIRLNGTASCNGVLICMPAAGTGNYALVRDATTSKAAGTFISQSATGFRFIQANASVNETAISGVGGTDPIQTGLAGADHFSFLLGRDGRLKWGPGGAVGGIDTNIYRGSAGVLRTDGAIWASGIRVIGDVFELAAAINMRFDTGTGSKIGTAADQKLAFWNATPIVQPVANPDTSGATLAALEIEVNQLKATLRSLGLIAT